MLKELRALKALSIGVLLGATVSVILSYNAITSLANIMNILHLDNPAGISFSICIGVLILGTLLQMLAGAIVLIYGKEKIFVCRFFGCAALFVNGINLILEIRSGSADSLVAATMFVCGILLPILYLMEVVRCQGDTEAGQSGFHAIRKRSAYQGDYLGKGERVVAKRSEKKKNKLKKTDVAEITVMQEPIEMSKEIKEMFLQELATIPEEIRNNIREDSKGEEAMQEENACYENFSPRVQNFLLHFNDELEEMPKETPKAVGGFFTTNRFEFD